MVETTPDTVAAIAAAANAADDRERRGPSLRVDAPFAYELYQGLLELEEQTCSFEAPRSLAAYTGMRELFMRATGLRDDDLRGEPMHRAFHAVDEAAFAWASNSFDHGLRVGMAFERYRRELTVLFPEVSCPACHGKGTGVGCDRCTGRGYVPARFGPPAVVDGGEGVAS